ncbi:MAG: hypothetical protein ACO3S5_12075 [Ilumatobacteraceae bacterium]|jgi:hypothetical protein
MARRQAPTWRTPLALLRWRSVRRGLLGGNPWWTVVAVLIWVPRLLRRLTVVRPEVLTTQVLRPGESLAVSTSARGRRERSTRNNSASAG